MDALESTLWQQGLFGCELSKIDAPSRFQLLTGTVAGQAEGDSLADAPSILVTTCGFGELDTGLSHEGSDVRSEVFLTMQVGSAPRGDLAPETLAARLLAAAVEKVALHNEEVHLLHAQPGTWLPEIGREVQQMVPELSAVHGLFVAPSGWGGDVPNYREPSRLTVMLELLLLTDDEYHHGITYGMGSLYEGMQEAGIVPSDLFR